VKVIVVTSMPDAMFLKRGGRWAWFLSGKGGAGCALAGGHGQDMAGEHVYPDNPPVAALGLAKSTDFTERELDVLRLLAEGLTDREIAERLFLSVTTIRYHVNNMIGKTGLSSRTELAVNAVRGGIVVPGIR
jgi:two-component system vancomycin resistance associated response regulator VraR